MKPEKRKQKLLEKQRRRSRSRKIIRKKYVKILHPKDRPPRPKIVLPPQLIAGAYTVPGSPRVLALIQEDKKSESVLLNFMNFIYNIWKIIKK
jgi:hypothetical protein